MDNESSYSNPYPGYQPPSFLQSPSTSYLSPNNSAATASYHSLSPAPLTHHTYVEDDLDEDRSVLHAFRTPGPSTGSPDSANPNDSDPNRRRAFSYSTPSYEQLSPIPPHQVQLPLSDMSHSTISTFSTPHSNFQSFGSTLSPQQNPQYLPQPFSAVSPGLSPGSTYDNPSNLAITPQAYVPQIHPLYAELESPDHSGANMIFRGEIPRPVVGSNGAIRQYAVEGEDGDGGENQALYTSYTADRTTTPAPEIRRKEKVIQHFGLGKAAERIRWFRSGKDEEKRGLIRTDTDESGEGRRRVGRGGDDSSDDDDTQSEANMVREEWSSEEVTRTGLRRGLKNRHVTMLSIGGVIGTGLFVGTANSLRNGGPLGTLLAYSIFGTITYAVLISLGEMVSHLPLAGGHISLSRRFVDPALSFAMGWAYWGVYTILLPTELAAAAVLIGYWNKTISNAVWIALTLILLSSINVFGARGYGEVEFWFASIKIITIVGLIILGLIIDAGGGPNGDKIGFRYWKNPGPLVQYLGIEGSTGRFLGFYSVFNNAAFAFIGTEIVAIAAAETKDPRKSIPRAIRSVFWRVLIFYVFGVFVVGLLIASDDPALNNVNKPGNQNAAASPWVIAIDRAGIRALPAIINASILTSALSAGSSYMFVSSRALFGMGLNGNAPRFFSDTTSWGLPWKALIVAVLFGTLGFIASGRDGAGRAFGYLGNVASVSWLLTWIGICITYLRWFKGCKKQKINRKTTFPYVAPLQPYAAYYGLGACSIITFFNGWTVFIKGKFDTGTFITSYIPIPIFVFLYLGYKFTYNTRVIPFKKMDFNTGAAEFQVETAEKERKQRPWYMKVWRVLF